MKALDEYFLMVVFMLLLDRDNVFALFMLICTEKYGSEMDRDPIQCGKSGFAAKVWKGLTLNRIVSYFKRALLFFCYLVRLGLKNLILYRELKIT